MVSAGHSFRLLHTGIQPRLWYTFVRMFGFQPHQVRVGSIYMSRTAKNASTWHPRVGLTLPLNVPPSMVFLLRTLRVPHLCGGPARLPHAAGCAVQPFGPLYTLPLCSGEREATTSLYIISVVRCSRWRRHTGIGESRSLLDRRRLKLGSGRRETHTRAEAISLFPFYRNRRPPCRTQQGSVSCAILHGRRVECRCSGAHASVRAFVSLCASLHLCVFFASMHAVFSVCVCLCALKENMRQHWACRCVCPGAFSCICLRHPASAAKHVDLAVPRGCLEAVAIAMGTAEENVRRLFVVFHLHSGLVLSARSGHTSFGHAERTGRVAALQRRIAFVCDWRFVAFLVVCDLAAGAAMGKETAIRQHLSLYVRGKHSADLERAHCPRPRLAARRARLLLDLPEVLTR